MITEQAPSILQVAEDAEALWKQLQMRRGKDWWLKAPLPELRAKLMECFHVWNASAGGEYQELLHLMVIARILALRVREGQSP